MSLCVCVCVNMFVCIVVDTAVSSSLLRAAEMFFILFGMDTKDPLTPITHHHNPECISPFKFVGCLCWPR